MRDIVIELNIIIFVRKIWYDAKKTAKKKITTIITLF